MARPEMMASGFRDDGGTPHLRLFGAALLLIPLVLSCAGPAQSAPGAARPESSSTREPVELGSDDGHRMLMDGSERFVNLILPDSVIRGLTSAPFEREQVYSSTRFVYRYFQDAFDFVMFVFDPPPSNDGQSVYWMSFGIRPPAEGLNFRFRDTTGEAGSAGRLESVILLRAPEDLISGPSLHEIMHNWGQRILPTDYKGHWGRSSVNGVLGGWRPGTLSLTEEGFYTSPGSRPGGPLMSFRRGGGNSVPYAALELYMMGLLPADSIAPVQVAVGAENVLEQGSAFTASGFDLYRIDQIISEHGPRIPAYPDAPRTFRSILVVISPAPLEARKWEKVSENVRRFTQLADDGDDRLFNFWEATGGRGELLMGDLAKLLKNEEVADTLRSGGDR